MALVPGFSGHLLSAFFFTSLAGAMVTTSSSACRRCPHVSSLADAFVPSL